MWKRIAFVAAVLAAGCGGGGSSGDVATSTEPPAGSLEGNVAVPRLVAGTDQAKIIARRISSVTTTLPVLDEDGNPVRNPDGSIQYVTSTTSTEVFRYVQNVAATATSFMLPDGDGYTIDVIAGGPPETVGTGAAARQVRPVLAQYRVVGATVGAGAAVAFGNVPAPAAPTFSTVYAGLAAPYDTFTATAVLAYPFNGAWTMTCGGVAGAVSGNRAVFRAPAANVAGGTLACEARYHLAITGTVPGEAPDAWEIASPSSVPVQASSSVAMP